MTSRHTAGPSPRAAILSLLVFASAAVIAPAQEVQVTVGTLPTGSSVTLDFDVTLPACIPAGLETIPNVASATGTNLAAPAVSNDAPITIAASPDMGLTVGDAPDPVAAGGTLVYSFGYTNAGNQAATGVELSVTLPAHTTYNAGASSAGWTCGMGGVCTLTLASAVSCGSGGTILLGVDVAEPIPAGVATIELVTASVSEGSGEDSNAANDSVTASTVVDAAPDLAVTAAPAALPVGPGDSLDIDIDVTNNGSQDATGVDVTAPVPDHTAFDAGSSTPGWVCVPDGSAGSLCTFTVGNLASGDSSNLHLVVTIDDPLAAGVDSTTTTVTVADDGANGADENPADNSAMVTAPLTAAPDLELTKDDGGASGAAGGQVVYALGVSNAGNQDATGVTVTETVPVSTSFAAGASSPGWACAPDGTAGSTCTFAVGSLGAGSTQSVDFAVVIDSLLPAGVDEISNQASTADDGANGADPTPANNAAADTTPVDAAPDLTVAKFDDTGINGVPAPGGFLEYTIEVDNVGSQGATGVIVTETVPTNTTFVPASSTPGWACVPDATAGSSCTLDAGTISAGDGSSFTFTVQLDDPPAPGTSELSNTVSVTDDGTNGADLNPADNETTLVTTLDSEPPTVLGVLSVPDAGIMDLDTCATVRLPVAAFEVVFSEPMFDPAGNGTTGDVTNPNGWRLIAAGNDADLDTTVCGAAVGDDVLVPLAGISFDPLSDTARLSTGGSWLPGGLYRLIACGTDLRDTAANLLDGNGDGTGGDDLVRTFRLDPFNAFVNGHLDCDLTGWDRQPPGSEVSWDDLVDADGSSLSGSARMEQLAAATQFAMSQCVPVFAELSLPLTNDLDLQTPPFGFVGITRQCRFYDAPGCGGVELPGWSQTTLAETTGGFVGLAATVGIPAGASSARCSLRVGTSSGGDFTAWWDQVFFDDGSRIFADGFESSDTSQWTAAAGATTSFDDGGDSGRQNEVAGGER